MEKITKEHILQLKKEMVSFIEMAKEKTNNQKIIAKVSDIAYINLPRAIDLLEIEGKDFSDLIYSIYAEAFINLEEAKLQHEELLRVWQEEYKSALYAVVRRKKYKEAGVDYNLAKLNILGGTPFHITEELYNTLTKDIKAQAAKEKEKKRTPDKLENVLTDLNLPNTIITATAYQYALTTIRNDVAYMRPYEGGDIQLEFLIDENTNDILCPVDANMAKEELQKEVDLKKHPFDAPLVRQLFAATLKSMLTFNFEVIKVYLPNFIYHMGIDVKYSKDNPDAVNKILRDKSSNLFEKLNKLESWAGIMNGKEWYRAFVLLSIKDNVLTYSAPYFVELISTMMRDPVVASNSKGQVKYKFLGISDLIKPSVMKARNKQTVDFMVRILTGLIQKGNENTRNGSPKPYEAKLKTLLYDLPSIYQNFTNNEPAKNTRLLRECLCGYMKKEDRERLGVKTKSQTHVFITKEDHENGVPYILEEYLRKYTDVYDRYKNFSIKYDIPSYLNLNAKIVIKHDGINKDYKSNYKLDINI